MWQYMNYKMPRVYKFDYEVPHFSSTQKQIIKKTLPQALSVLKDPEEYYLSDIQNGDTITLIFNTLATLQTGGNSKGLIVISIDNPDRHVKFDKNYNFIKCEPFIYY
jgi:hypothetical protein